MKSLILITAAALLTAGCDKPQEKQAPAETAPKPQGNRRPVTTPPQNGDPAKPTVPAASAAEVEAFFADLEALAKQVESLDKPAANGSPAPDLEALQKSFTALVTRRKELMAGMTEEGKRELAERFAPSMRRVGLGLARHRHAKTMEKLKNTPGLRVPSDGVPPELLDPLPVPSEERPPPPAPGDGAPPPR